MTHLSFARPSFDEIVVVENDHSGTTSRSHRVGGGSYAATTPPISVWDFGTKAEPTKWRSAAAARKSLEKTHVAVATREHGFSEDFMAANPKLDSVWIRG